MMRHILFFLFFLVVTQSVVAQKRGKLKYKEVYDVVLNGTQYEAYEALKAFQEQNPKENLNVYFQLGKICQKWMRTYDPLRQPEEVDYFSRHAKIYLGLCKGEMNEDEIKDNQDYYYGVELRSGKNRVQKEDVLLDLDNRLADVENFRKNHEEMLLQFRSMLEHYNSCIDQFMDINRTHSNIKELYMTADAGFISKLDQLKNTYDSAIFYYNAYKAVITNYQIGDYQQEAKIEEIKTYRLDGLASSNFMADLVTIWNFGKWVDDFKQKMETEIRPLKTEVAETGKKLNESIAFFNQTNEVSDDWKAYEVPSQLRFKIGKYDYESAILDLFTYKESKAKFLEWQKKSKSRAEHGEYSFEQLSQYYQNLIEKKKVADSTLQIARERINGETFIKYPDYLGIEFGSVEGFRNYLNQEQAHSDKLLERTIQGFKFILTHPIWEREQKRDTATVKKLRIPAYANANQLGFEKLQLNKFDTIETNLYYTVDVAEKAKSKYWVAGYHKLLGKLPYPFVAKIEDRDSLQTIDRFATFRNKDTVSHCTSLIRPTDNGGAVFFNTELHDTIQHQLVWVDSLGKVKKMDSVKIDALPIWLELDELNGLVFMVFRGKSSGYYRYGELEPMYIRLQGVDGTVFWERTMNIKGDLVDVVRFGSHWVLVGNYSQIEHLDETEEFAPNNQTAGYVAFFTEQGKLDIMKTFKDKMGLSLFKAIKTNSNTLNLIGIKDSGVAKSVVANKRHPIYFALIDKQGELIFSNEEE